MTRARKARRSRERGLGLFESYGMPRSRVLESPGKHQSSVRGSLSMQSSRKSERNFEVRYKKEVFALARVCETMADILRAEQARQRSIVQRPQPDSKLDNFYVHRSGKTMNIMKVIQTSTRVNHMDTATLGLIREKGSPNPLMGSLSGWTANSQFAEDLLDNSIWTLAVLEFCQILNYRIRRSWRDKTRPGQCYGSHVEKKLILFYVCQALLDPVTGKLSKEKFDQIRNQTPPREAEIVLTRSPCLDCLRFKEVIEKMCYIKFTINVCVGGLANTITTRNKHGFLAKHKLVSEQDEEVRRVGRHRKRVPSPFTPLRDTFIPSTSRIMVLIHVGSSGSTSTSNSALQTPEPVLRTPQRSTRSSGLLTPESSPLGYFGLSIRQKPTEGSEENPICLD